MRRRLLRKNMGIYNGFNLQTFEYILLFELLFEQIISYSLFNHLSHQVTSKSKNKRTILSHYFCVLRAYELYTIYDIV
ncbi:hypothetical protein QLX08_007817 [Tetragonisca angustula]|uniref:Uncharacterized protein n=1 Tax=Tetragonisca angustula TaxID=166442 RepID=A0AAW0ZN91_9HYME